MENNDFEIIVRRTKIASNFVELKRSPYHIYNYSPNLKKVLIRISVKSNSNRIKNFDPNKLYLVSNELKQRYRPIDLQFTFILNRSFGLNRLISDSALSSIGNLSPLRYEPTMYGGISQMRYDPTIKDTFKDYSITGYKDIEFEINYGSLKKPKNAVVYFEPIKVIEYVFDVYFLVPQSITTGEFYFGNKDLKQCHFVKK